MNVRLVNNAKYYQKYVSKPSFVSQKIISENFVAIHESFLIFFIKNRLAKLKMNSI